MDKKFNEMNAVELTELVVRFAERFESLKSSVATVRVFASAHGDSGNSGDVKFWINLTDRQIAEIDKLLEVYWNYDA